MVATAALLGLSCRAEVAPTRAAPVVQTPEAAGESMSEPPQDDGVEPIQGGLDEEEAALAPAAHRDCRGVAPARQGEGGNGREVDLVGRVVTPAGAPIADATVTLVDLAIPIGHRTRHGTSALVEARTNSEGCFGIQGRGGAVWDDLYLLVEAGGMRRAFDLRDLRQHDLEVRLAPARQARIVVECARGRAAQGSVTGYWHGVEGKDVVLARGLYPAGMDPPEDPLLPNIDRDLTPEESEALSAAVRPRSSSTARTDVRLPLGTSTLIIESECGVAIHEVEVAPGPGPLETIRVRVPHPRSASISVRLREPVPENQWADLEGVTVWSGEYFRRNLILRRDGRTATLDGLPPGDYQVGNRDGPECWHTVTLAPDERRAMILDDADCAVWRWRRPDYY